MKFTDTSLQLSTVLNVWRLCQIIFFFLINRIVDEPYMDEEFHIRQAQKYCLDNFDNYDEKLTTPPGLYMISYVLSKLGLPCSIDYLRLINLFVGIILLPNLLIRVRGAIHPIEHRESSESAKLLSMMPIFSFFSLLYYTDLWSVYLVIYCHYSLLRHRTFSALLAGLFSLCFRQTNIVWVLAFFAIDVLSGLERLHKLDVLHLHQVKVNAVIKSLRSLLSAVMHQKQFVCFKIISILPIITTGITFFVWNDYSIVLGDQANHVAGLHPIQILYMSAFMTGMSFTREPEIASYLFSISRRKRRIAWFAAIIGLCTFIMGRGVVVHPFTLADNRHYVFYLHRRVLSRLHPLVASFGYAICLSWINSTLQDVSFWTMLILVVATCCTLIPTSLLEFRYYMVPFILWRLYARPSSPHTTMLESTSWLFLHLVATLIFVFRPFMWPNSDQAQRFMW